MKVLEYSRETQALYVLLKSTKDEAVYEIDLVSQRETLKTVGWFEFDDEDGEKEDIVGGNSQVLVEATKSQFWFDVKSSRTDTDTNNPTEYDKLNISDWTAYPIYEKGSQVYNFLGSYFQYVSFSSDRKNMTTFIWFSY